MATAATALASAAQANATAAAQVIAAASRKFTCSCIAVLLRCGMQLCQSLLLVFLSLVFWLNETTHAQTVICLPGDLH